MPDEKSKKPTGGPQFSRFVETARALGCDEDKARFEAKLGKIAAQKPIAKNAETGLEVGICDNIPTIDDEVRLIMLENSRELEKITSKSPY